MNEHWRLTFPNITFTGESATEVLKRLSKTQWTDDERRNVKRALAWRTYVLTQQMINENDDDATFLRNVCEAGLATLEVDKDGTTERIERTDWA